MFIDKDLCFLIYSDEEDAEIRCEEALQKALKYDSQNFEALQAYASFRISQTMFDDALKLLRKSYYLWKDLGLFAFIQLIFNY